MKKVILSVAVVAAFLSANNAKAQLIDEQNVTVTMDLQPILQLGMNGSSNVDFVFDQISEYIGGITQYGATNLTVSSTVSWDLYAAGFSSNAGSAGANLIWDNQVVYGQGNDINATTELPLTLLELHQDKVNPGLQVAPAAIVDDYFLPFAALQGGATVGLNNVYATATPYSRPAATEKYIAGHFASTNFVVGGTYLYSLNSAAVGANSSYYYSMDYRIVPGLPAIFPNASSGNTNTALDLTAFTGPTFGAGTSGTYARPGV